MQMGFKRKSNDLFKSVFQVFTLLICALIYVLSYRNCHICRGKMVTHNSCLAIGIVVSCLGFHREWNVKWYFRLFVVRLGSSRICRFRSKILLNVCVYPHMSTRASFNKNLINCVHVYCYNFQICTHHSPEQKRFDFNRLYCSAEKIDQNYHIRKQ